MEILPSNLKQDMTLVAERMNKEFSQLQSKYPDFYFDITVERQAIGRKNFYRNHIKAMKPGSVDPKQIKLPSA